MRFDMIGDIVQAVEFQLTQWASQILSCMYGWMVDQIISNGERCNRIRVVMQNCKDDRPAITYFCHNQCIYKMLRHPCAIECVESNGDWANTILGIAGMGTDVDLHGLSNDVPICLEWKSFDRSARIDTVDLQRKNFLLVLELKPIFVLKILTFLMNDLMSFQSLLKGKTLSAQTAWKRTILLMAFDVLLQVFGIQIFPVTEWTHMFWLFNVNFLMPWQQCRSREWLRTDDTLEWFFSTVDEGVFAEIVFTEE